jgi:hypothetical protein
MANAESMWSAWDLRCIPRKARSLFITRLMSCNYVNLSKQINIVDIHDKINTCPTSTSVTPMFVLFRHSSGSSIKASTIMVFEC